MDGNQKIIVIHCYYNNIILIFSLSISVSLSREPNFKPVGALPVIYLPVTESTVDEYTNPKIADSSIDKDTSGAEGDSNKSSEKAIDEKSLTSAITSILDPTTVIDISKSIEYADNNTATELAKYDNLNIKYANINSFMEKFDKVTLELCKMSQEVLWNYVTDIGDVDKKNNMIAISAKEDKIKKLYWEILRNDFLSPLEVQPLNISNTIYNETFSRKIKIIRERGTNVLMPQSKQREEIDSMQNIWSTARVCSFKDQHCKNEKNSKPMEDISKLFTTNQDYDELLYYWHKWRDATGRKIRPTFRQYIDRVNNVSRNEGYKDAGDLWRFSFETEDLSEKVDKLWTEIKPLYKLLHNYVRSKLSSFYEPNYEASDGMIPEHILSNLWGQQWQHLYSIMTPYAQAPRVNIKTSMQANNWTARSLFENVDQFYTSMGMLPMVDAYGNRSILTKPENMVINCAPSSHDMCDGVNYRVKMCAEQDEENLQTAARLLGHVQYYMQYKNQPYLFRDGPNPAFHDAIADLIGIQILSPKHLAFMNLTDGDESKEDKINFLMRMALEKLPLIGYAYVLDKWRWTIFENDTLENWNGLWWDMRKELTMIEAPLMRNESDLDPASKYHVVSHVQYITYFVSYLLEFQILRSLCIHTNQYNETSTDDDNLLMDCHLYGDAEAGEKLSAGMKLGASEDWKAVLRTITGEDELSADGILAYFQPLEKFLKIEKKRVVKFTEDMDQSAPITVGVILVILTLLIALIYCMKKKKYGPRISSAIGLSKNGSLDITNNVDSDKGKVNEAMDQISEDRV